METAVAPAELKPHRFTIEDYLKMGEAGILEPEDRVELIDGQVVSMSPIGNWHIASIMQLNKLLAESLRRRKGRMVLTLVRHRDSISWLGADWQPQ